MSDYAEGGIVYRTNGPDDDLIEYEPETGYVISAEAARRYGAELMEELRNRSE